MSDISPRPTSQASSIDSRTSQSERNAEAPQPRQTRPPAAPWQPSFSMFTAHTRPPGTTAGSSHTRSESGGNPGQIDRVFPVRSAVSIDRNAISTLRNNSFERTLYGTIPDGESLLATRKSGDQNHSSATMNSRGPPSAGTSSLPDSFAVRDRAESTSDRTEMLRRSSLSSAKYSSHVNNQTLDSLFSGDTNSIQSSRPPSSRKASTDGRASIRSDQEEGLLMTARFTHVVTDGGHAVITGRDGQTLQRCEDEPIHIPGAVQSFGLLIAFKEEGGKLVVHVVSENSARIIGYTPQQLFKLDNFLDIFSDEQADNLLDHLDFIRDEDSADVVANGPEVFVLSIRPPQHKTRKLWCAMHQCALDKETVIIELEIEDDIENPLAPSDNQTPDPPEDTLGSEPTQEEFEDSTVNISKPLRVLRGARKRRGEAAAMEVFNIMSQVQEQLANATTLSIFLKVLIGVVKELTGFHRVMVYQFDQSWNGRVVAELVDPRATKDLYKGLNFPASDIPSQARDMYKLNKVRLLYDRDQETARLVCRTPEDLEKPLDLTHSYLRAMSPIHVKYLTNMAVRSSMSISINAFNELWGLIACHTYGSKPTRVSFPIRKMCRLVGDTASRNIERLSYASRLQARKLINTTSSAKNPTGYIVASSEDLLHLFEADLGALSIRGETKVMGQANGHLQEVLAMVEFLRLKGLDCIVSSQDISTDYPDLKYAPGLRFLAGLLYVPLSSQGHDFIVFFRKGVLQEVKWAGNPYEKYIKEGTEGYLEPRKSFKQWSETIVSRCRDWTHEEIETASILCLVYGKFIDVWRQKEAALQNSQLTKLLLANSAHEVRTPLNAIINYLEIALEGSLDQDTRDNLARSHSASKSLVYVINDLLDLTKTEEHKNLIKAESFDLHHTLREATDPFKGDARRKGIKYNVSIDETIPEQVLGDHRRVRQVISNLIANAIQHTASGSVNVEISRADENSDSERCDVEICVEDTGSGMPQEKVDALFRELEEVSVESDTIAKTLIDGIPNEKDNENSIALGLGLAVVARTIRNMNGQLRLKTEPGQGSRFTILLSFRSSSTNRSPSKVENKMAQGAGRDASPSRRDAEEGEVTLVTRGVAGRGSLRSKASPIHRQESADSIKSLVESMKSGRSGHSQTSNKSDADRLIDAIQEPLQMVGTPGKQYSGRKVIRSSSDAGGNHNGAVSAKSRSIGSTSELKSSMSGKAPGQEPVRDSRTPIRPVRVPDVQQTRPEPRVGAKVKFQEDQGFIEHVSSAPAIEERRDSPMHVNSSKDLHVLVAEDDPINSKIMRKRLEKLGHTAYMTVNGEECASTHGEHASQYDVVLMDLQMPIVDGFGATKMIRSSEKVQSASCLSPRAGLNGRIPIFAVSASLEEKLREKYIECGFDGWILKPVDFQRIDQLMRGIVDKECREECLYKPGQWEQGGWFERYDDAGSRVFDAETTPDPSREVIDGKTPVQQAEESSSNAPPTEGSVTPKQISGVADTE